MKKLRVIKAKITGMLKITIVISLVAIITEGLGRVGGLAPSDIVYHYAFFESQLNQLERDYGVRFTTNLEPKNYPEHKGANKLLNDQTVIHAVANSFDLSRSFKWVYNSLKKYPPDILLANIHNIYLLDELTVRGSKSDGTYDTAKKSIYIRNTFQINGLNHQKIYYLTSTLNHEISSILMQKYHFKNELWRQAMGPHFLYENDKDPTYEWMFVHGYIDSSEYSDKESLLQRGLLRQYAETGLENDFNTYAELIFTDPARMKHLIHNYPVIAKKYQVFKQFYLSIDPGFAPVFEVID